jgi:hypothetical protein
VKKDDVPQEALLFGPWKEICYAVDKDGRYVLEPCAGWEPANFANQQAWLLIRESVQAALEAVRAGRRSPLAFHMAVHQMDAGLLARYVGLSRFRVWLHLRPRGFARMRPEEAGRYAELFGVSPEQLGRVPDEIRLDGLIREDETP